ncbi:hypothetical protein QMK33_06055 [Hymenobacter sp. H14-R3]|uniref:DUF6882 domain-containing protein n=1 Tax=Hymenobacter sp. H14-R3 TaxID=3046308 RepID=UPI0024BB9FDD|nr:DUF6882 domain-containing protein [Hymenobacter sp. H14-R3]MDJ0364709.1 hypothetical protein [Hymenobacter sp. H14-R3]
MFSLSSLYTQHAARSLEKLLALQALTGDPDFDFNLGAGTLSFGAGFTYPMQILGTVSRQSSTWQWAWASPQALPAALLLASEQLQELGAARGIEEFTSPRFAITPPPAPAGSLLGLHQQLGFAGRPAAPLDGHLLAMVGAGVCGADAYYGADYGPGIAYVLLPSVPGAAAHWAQEPGQLAEVFRRVLALPYALDARAAFSAYLTQKGYALETDGGLRLRGVKGERWLAARFDDAGQLTELEPDQEEPT